MKERFITLTDNTHRKLQSPDFKNFNRGQLFSRTYRDLEKSTAHGRSPSKEIGHQTEDLQTGQCKLVFLPQFSIKTCKSEVGFKSFTEMMKSNTSWMQTKINTSKLIKGKRCKAGESPENSVNIFPQYLSNRLEFNKSQTDQFVKTISEKWSNFCDESSGNQTKPSYRRHPKIKMTTHDFKNLDDSSEQDGNDKQRQKLDIDFVQVKLKNLKFYWYSIQSTEQWKPSNREGCSITFVENSSKCILYGGIGCELFNNFISLNTRTWVWQDLGPGTGDKPLVGRFGHSANPYKRGIIIYGGEKKYNPTVKMRECYNDVNIYYPHNNNWQFSYSIARVRQKTLGQAEGRRNHSAVVCGKYLFIMGGINSYGLYLQDIISLNLETLKWLSYDVENFYLDGIAFATAIALFKGDIKMENSNKPFELIRKNGKKLLKLGHEGIYMFGGRSQSGEALNDLRVIIIGCNPLQTFKIQTKGIGPTPRYMHTMNYFENLNLCVIYGGRDDSVTKDGPLNIKNDICLIEMHQFNWIQIQQLGIPNSGKCSHSSAFLGSKLLIFGGYTAKSLNNSDLQFVEMDQEKTRTMIKEIKNRQTGNSNHLMDYQNIYTIKEIEDDVQLKVFVTDTCTQPVSHNQSIRPDNQTLMQRNSKSQSYNNFISFQPLPLPEPSLLMKQFQQNRDKSILRGDSKSSIRSKLLEPILVKNSSSQEFQLELSIKKSNLKLSVLPVEIGETSIEDSP